MVNIVMKRASPMRTEFGGVCAVPIADRIIDSTTMILRKEVMEMSRKGIRDITDIESNIWTLLLNPGEFIIPATSTPKVLGAA
jgi:hypothetical protein